jgi:hypothetical protein
MLAGFGRRWHNLCVRAGVCSQPRPQEEAAVSRVALIIVSLVVGVALAFGATFTTTALITQAPTPSNQATYNYGG